MGPYGPYSMDEFGTLYILGNPSNQAIRLAQGETYTDTLIISVGDYQDTHQLEIVTVNYIGQNSLPGAREHFNSVTAAGYGIVGIPLAEGNVMADPSGADYDPDHGAVLHVLAGDTGYRAGDYGTFHLNGDGSYGYELDNSAANVQALTQGQVVADIFDYTVQDEHGATSYAPGAVTINITGTNDAPVVTGSSSGTVTEDGSAITIDALSYASDVDQGTTLSVFIGAQPNWPGGVTYDASSHSFTLNPGAAAYQHLAQGEVQTVTVNYAVADGWVTTPASMVFTVYGTDDPLVQNGQPSDQVGQVGSVFSYALPNNLFTGDELTYTATLGNGSALPSWLTYDAATQTFSGTPTLFDTGSDAVRISVTDAHGASLHADFSVAVAGLPNEQVVIFAEDSSADINLTADGLVGNPQSYSVANQPSHGLLTGSGATLTYTPQFNFSGQDSFSYFVIDDAGDSIQGEVGLSVSAVADAPTLNVPSYSLGGMENTAIELPITAALTDMDGSEVLSVIIAGLPTGSAFSAGVDNGNGSWSVPGDQLGGLMLTPPQHFSGPLSLTVTATATELSNNDTATTSATLGLNFGHVNHAPTATNESAITAEDTPAAINVLGNDTDADNDPLTVTGATALHGAVSININNTLAYAPNPNYNGADTITYAVSDGHGGTANAAVAVTITPVNDPPVAMADTATTSAISPVTIDVLANDTDPDFGDTKAIFSLDQTGTLGSISVVGGQVVYSPGGAFASLQIGQSATDSFHYTMRDSSGAESTATVTVTVTGTGSSAPSLFTPGNDVVNFNNVLAQNYAPGTQYDAGAGDDSVTLPGNSFAAATAGFDTTQIMHLGAGNDFLDAGILKIGGIDGGPGTDSVHFSITESAVTADMYSGIAMTTTWQEALTSIENVSTASVLFAIDDAQGTNNIFESLGAANSVFEAASVSYEHATGPVAVDLAAGIASGISSGTDQLIGINAVIGSDSNDTIAGDANMNVLSGRGGADIFVFRAAGGLEILDLDFITDFSASQGDVLDLHDLFASPDYVPSGMPLVGMGSDEVGNAILYADPSGWGLLLPYAFLLGVPYTPQLLDELLQNGNLVV